MGQTQNDPFNLGVPWGYDFINVHNNQVTAAISGTNSGTANLSAIQAAITAVSGSGGSVILPAGTFTIDKGTATTALTIPANVVVQGAGIGNTIINDVSQAIPNGTYSIFISLTGGTSGVTGISYNQTMALSGSTHPPAVLNQATSTSDLFLTNVDLNFASAIIYSGTTPTGVTGGGFEGPGNNCNNELISGCTISHSGFGTANATNDGFGYDVIFRNNTVSSIAGRCEFYYITNLLIEKNNFVRDGSFPPFIVNGNGNGGIEVTGADHKILNNIFSGTNLPIPEYNDGESINMQAGPVFSYFGEAPAVSGTITSTGTGSNAKLIYDSTKSWTSNEWNLDMIWITSGSGQGEWSMIGGSGTDYVATSSTLTTGSGATYTLMPANQYLMSSVTSAANVNSGTGTLTDTTQNWPVNFYNGTSTLAQGTVLRPGCSVAIVKGPGIGQIATIIGNTSNTLTVTPAWIEPPGAGSQYVINGAYAYGVVRTLIKGNTFTDVPRGIVYYLGGYDCVTANNTLDSADGIILTASQRNWTTDGTNALYPYNRLDIGWHNLFVDNVVTNADQAVVGYGYEYGAYHTYQGAASITAWAGVNTDCPLFGAMLLGNEYRRNILNETIPGLGESYGSVEGFVNLFTGSGSDANDGTTGILGTVYDDNVSIGGTFAYVDLLNSGTWGATTAISQTTLWNSLVLSGSLIVEAPQFFLDGTFSALNTSGNDPCIFQANFSGTTTSTGGATDLVYTGATGLLEGNIGGDSIAVVSGSSPFGYTSTYISATTGTSGGNAPNASVQFTPTTARTSWGRIFDYRSIISQSGTYLGQWQVNGGFDFFWVPVQTPAANSMVAFEMSNESYGNSSNYLELAFACHSASTLAMDVATSASGGGASITGTYSPGFVAGSVYHVGVTWATNATTGVTTQKMFVASGTGAIITSGSGAAAPIVTGTFMLNPAVVTDTAGFIGDAPWYFPVTTYQDGVTHTNYYDSLRLYNQDPGVFPACNQ